MNTIKEIIESNLSGECKVLVFLLVFGLLGVVSIAGVIIRGLWKEFRELNELVTELYKEIVKNVTKTNHWD